jgi:hypothetical protein
MLPQQVVAALWPNQAQVPHLQPWEPYFSICSFTASAPAKPSAEELQHQSSYLQQLTAGLAASGAGCIRTLVELPPNCRHSPLQLAQWLQAWGAAGEAGSSSSSSSLPKAGPSKDGSKLLAASADRGLVVWCPEKKGGVVLPPGFSDVLLQPTTYIFPRRSCVGSSSSSSSSGGNYTALQLTPRPTDQSWPSIKHSQLLLKQGEQLHILQVQEEARAAASSTAGAAAAAVTVRLPPAALSREGLLLLAADTGSFCMSMEQALLVLDVTESVAKQLNEM